MCLCNTVSSKTNQICMTDAVGQAFTNCGATCNTPTRHSLHALHRTPHHTHCAGHQQQRGGCRSTLPAQLCWPVNEANEERHLGAAALACWCPAGWMTVDMWRMRGLGKGWQHQHPWYSVCICCRRPVPLSYYAYWAVRARPKAVCGVHCPSSLSACACCWRPGHCT